MSRTVRGFAALLAITALWSLAPLAIWIHLTVGPPVRRVHVRWMSSSTDVQRAAAEREWRLADGMQETGETWSYRLDDRSRGNIAAIIESPLVADTGYLDPRALRVLVDRPDARHATTTPALIVVGAPWLWPLIAADRMPLISAVLGLAGLVIAWTTRTSIVAALVWLFRALAILLRRFAAVTIPLFESPAERQSNPGVRRWEWVAAVALGLAFLGPLLAYGPYEEEVVQHSVFPNQLFYRALFSGRWLYWVNDLGFGTPLPGDTLLFHPLFGPLAAFASLRITLTVVWLAHTMLMATAFLRLSALTGVRAPALRLVLLALYLFSAVSMVYFYDTDWVTAVITWSLYPVLALALRAAVLGGAFAAFWPTTLGLAVLFGFWILNGHPGSIAPVLAVLVVYALVAAPPRARVYVSLVVAGLLCGVIAAAHVYTLIHEAQMFPMDTPPTGDGITWKQYFESALAVTSMGRRVPFIGLGLWVAIGMAIVGLLANGDRHLRACAAAFAAAIAFGFLPRGIVQWLSPSGASLFRDPFVFFGLLIGGAALQRCFDSPVLALRRAALALVVIQAVQQGRVIDFYSLDDFVDHHPSLLFYEHQGRPFGLGTDLVEAAHTFGPRVYMSPRIEAAMRGTLSPYGVHFSSDLVFLGLNPVNGWFKNVSMSVLYPPTSIMESTVTGDRNVLSNRSLLDVLGIDLVLVADGDGPPPAGLEVVKRLPIRSRRLDSDLVITGNPDAWPRAVLMETSASTLRLPVNSGCLHRAALCRDYTPLATRRLPGDVSLQSIDGEYTATFAPADSERVLFISGLYRPEWQAVSSAGERLPVFPIAGAFLGISVPAGVTGMRAEYAPRVQQALTWFSTLTFGSLVCAWCVLQRKHARGRRQERHATVPRAAYIAGSASR